MRAKFLPAFEHLLSGRYEMGRVLGRGAMGIVVEARDRVLERMVVAKILSRDLVGDARAAARLIREGRVAARVSHPNIAVVLDLGLLETGEPYLVMEHLVGHDLGECMDDWGALSLADALVVVEPVAQALDCLHDAGLVHRDVKPSNVFVLDGTPTRVKLIDFGLALFDDAAVARFTQQGLLSGAVEYLAPELAHGAAPTASADIYSLATIAYEMLAGRLPFEGPPLEALVAKARLTPPRLDALGVANEQVATVIERALSPHPCDRPVRSIDLVQDLAAAGWRRPPARPPAVAVPREPSIAPERRIYPEAPIVIPRDARYAGATLAMLALLALVLTAVTTWAR